MPIDININYSQTDKLGRPFGIEGINKMLQKYRIDSAILVSQMAVEADFREGNRELHEAIKNEQRLFGYLVLNPNYPEESVELMRSAMSMPKFTGMAFFQGASRPYPCLEDCNDLLNAYRRYTKPVLLHTPHREAVEAAMQISKAFATIKFIFGSMGGDDWKAATACCKQLNVVLETSGSFDAEKIEDAVEQFGSHKVLFGSNAPISDPSLIVALVQSSKIPKTAMMQILGENASKLFRFGGESEPEPEEEE